MKKTLLILSFILLSVTSFAQRQRTTAMFDSDTTTRPKAGFYGIGVRANNIYFVPPTGNNIRLANYSLFTGLTTNYVTKWNGSKLVNSAVFESAGNVGIGTISPAYTIDVNGKLNSISNAFGNGGYRISAFSGAGGSRSYLLANDINNYGDFGIIQSTTNANEPSVIRMLINSSGNVGIGTNSPTSKLQVKDGDIEVETIASGLILKSANGTRWRVTVNNSGVLVVTSI